MLGLAERLLSSIAATSLAMAPLSAAQSFSVSPAAGCHFIRRFSIRPTARVEHQREHRQHHDAGHHGVDVERALGLQDQVADAARRAQVLADHRADEGQADRGVQAE